MSLHDWHAGMQTSPRYEVFLILGVLTLVAIGLMLPFDPQSMPANQGILTPVMQAVSLPGVMPWNAVVVGGGLMLLVAWMGWRVAGYLALITGLQGLVTTVLKAAVPVERPNDVNVNAPLAVINNAFPSGHVIFYVVFFGFLFYLLWVKLDPSFWRELALVTLAGLIVLGGASRLYLGTHWFADVAGGQVIGFVLVIIAIEGYKRYVEE